MRRILLALESEGAQWDHYGPTAQDFHAAFGLGDDDKMIGSQDADGVALAAIQGLNAKLEKQAGARRDDRGAARRDRRAPALGRDAPRPIGRRRRASAATLRSDLRRVELSV